jgi:signal transduction histidine kinase
MNSSAVISLLLLLALLLVGYLLWLAQQRNRALQVLADQAQFSKQRLQDFLASMSHHLRTPLNGVMGYAEYIYSSTREPMIQFTSKIILENSLQMLHLVNGLLDLTKIQEGTLDLSNSEFEIQDLVESVRALHQVRANELGISLQVSTGQDAPMRMRADPYRVRQVLNNLVDNAINYNKPQGSVMLTVSSSANGQFVTFSVEDTGKGVPDEIQKTLFKRLHDKQVPFVLRPNEGSGLGLVLSHQLVSLMGGFLDFSTQAGQGSLFFFTLPVREESTS